MICTGRLRAALVFEELISSCRHKIAQKKRQMAYEGRDEGGSYPLNSHDRSAMNIRRWPNGAERREECLG